MAKKIATIAERQRGFKLCTVQVDASYDEEFIKLMKTLHWADRHYDPDTKQWFFTPDCFNQLKDFALTCDFDDVVAVSLDGTTEYLRRDTSQPVLF